MARVAVAQADSPAMSLRILVVPAVAALALTACGEKGPSADEQRAAKASAAAAKRKREQERKAAARLEKAQAAVEDCASASKPLLDAVEDLDARLSIGLNYDEYTDAVGDVAVAYRKSDFAEVGNLACLAGVGVPLEKAFNQHIKASSTWDECFDSYECSNDDIDGDLQAKWSRATSLLERAKRNLGRFQRKPLTILPN